MRGFEVCFLRAQREQTRGEGHSLLQAMSLIILLAQTLHVRDKWNIIGLWVEVNNLVSNIPSALTVN